MIRERTDKMVSIVSKELHFDGELKKKIEFICDFRNKIQDLESPLF